MVDKSVVLSTVKNMLDSGLDLDIIKDTLKDIGLSDSEVTEVLKQARSERKPAENAPEKVLEQDAEEETETQEPEEGIEMPEPLPLAPAQKYQPQMPQASNEIADSAGVQNAVLELGSKIEELKERIDGFSGISPASTNAQSGSQTSVDYGMLQARLDSLSNDVKELKAGTNALVDLMKKILETDRQVLLSLEGKRK